MAEDKNGFRRHVRAAKEWLGETEASLDKAENIKGDLSFMLARAEMERAREVKKKSRLQKLFPQLAALLTACVLAAAWLLWQQDKQEQVSTPAVKVQQDKLTEEESEKKVISESLNGKAAEVQTIEPAEKKINDEKTQESTNKMEALPETEPNNAQPLVPEEDLQQLMSEAGRILRAQ